jgi:transposase-like protein
MPNRTTYSRLNNVECPACGLMSEVTDSFEMGERSEFDCFHCGRTLVVLDEDTVRYWTVGVKDA